MTMLKTTETTSGEEKKRQLVFFNSLSEQFDPEKCTSDQKFTVNPNNEYVVMIRTLAPIPVRLLDETKQLHVASGSLLLGYNISLKQQDMTLTVGEGTKMSLLLNSNNNNNHELTIDMQHEPGQLCYVITLMTPNVTLTVGPKTSLALLLQSGHLRVTMYMVTEELAKQLKQPLQERDRVRHQVNSVHQAALDCSSRDPRKRKAVNSLFRPIAQYRPCSPTTTPPPALF